MRKVAVLGSTGSIGTQTLEVIKNHSETLCTVSLVAFSNKELLNEQSLQFNVQYSGLICEDESCLIEAVKNCDIAVIATRGIAALDAVLYCIDHNIDVALANKEVLVCAGEIINDALLHSKSKLLPVDSEHSAIFQCLESSQNKPKKIILTASGGAFYNLSKAELFNVTPSQAKSHPNWNMGEKITVDSATMMNKTFEVIEAHHLFNLPVDSIEIVVHRQSIVHSLVEFTDGSTICQMSNPDMKLPIQYALTYPQRLPCNVKQLDLTATPLTFEKCNFSKFPCANLAYLLAGKHPLIPTVLNAANDVCVEAFLQGVLKYVEIYPAVSFVLSKFEYIIKDIPLTVCEIKNVDKAVREFTRGCLPKVN